MATSEANKETSIIKWTNQLWYIQKMEHYLTFKTNEPIWKMLPKDFIAHGK